MKKSILQFILAVLARATVRRFDPFIIGVTGSVGKTSTRLAIAAVLSAKYSVRTAEKNYNNEIGLPLAILGMAHEGRNVFGWTWAILGAVKRLLFGYPYPEVLVLEYGIDHPGDMDYLLSIARPHIAAVTAIGDIPVHVEFFGSADEVAEEKGKLIAAIPADGRVILNRDDRAVYDMKTRTKAKVMTFGKEKRADMRILSAGAIIKDKERGIAGTSFKVEYEGNIVPIRLYETFGFPQAQAAAAAALAGIAMKMNLVEASGELKNYRALAGRMRMLKGVGGSLLLDDTYNAAPAAMREALETLRTVPGKRKIAVLGDMLEIGKYTEKAHRAVGKQVAECADMLYCVGARARFIADEALRQGMKEAAIAVFDEDAKRAGETLRPFVKEGDVILIKGSQGMRMEKAVLELMAQPEKAAELLVRQEKHWKK